MSTVAIVILTVVITLGAAGIGYLYLKSRKQGQSGIPWDEVRPILSEMFTEAVKIIEADKIGYQALEDYAVNFVKEKIDETSFLTDDEKALFSLELIRSLIGPRLKELYEKG